MVSRGVNQLESVGCGGAIVYTIQRDELHREMRHDGARGQVKILMEHLLPIHVSYF